MTFKYKNNAYSTLSATLAIGATSMSVQTGHGDRFPIIAGSDVCYITLEDTGGNREIVKVTARASGADSMTIVRAQEGTAARAWVSGDTVEQRITAGELDRYEAMSNVDEASSKATPVDADYLPIKDSAASNALKYLTWANLKATLLAAASLVWTAAHTFRAANAIRSEAASTQDAVVIAGRAGGTSSYAVTMTPTTLTGNRTATLPDASITVAGVNAAQSFTAMQRAAVVSDNDGAFDITSAAGNDFTWTPTGADVLDFTNEIVGARGCILLNNASGYAITLGSEVDADANCASTLSTAGKYWINYWCYDGTNVAITYSSALV